MPLATIPTGTMFAGLGPLHPRLHRFLKHTEAVVGGAEGIVVGANVVGGNVVGTDVVGVAVGSIVGAWQTVLGLQSVSSPTILM
jgi:hypothetical protein